MPPQPQPPAGWKPLNGIVTPLATPLLGQDIIDEKGAQQLIEHVLQGGVAGIFLLGSTGEGPSLSPAAKRAFVEYCCRIVAGRVPVLVSVSDTSFSETIALAQLVAAMKHNSNSNRNNNEKNKTTTTTPNGTLALVLTTPYYFTMSQGEVLQYAESVIAAVPDDLPILLYNIPFLTKTQWSIDTVRRLAMTQGQIVGMKDSSGDMAYFEQLCHSIKQQDCRPDFTVLIGPEHLLPEAVRAGGDGGVNGGANVMPELFVNLYQALTENSNKSEIDDNDDDDDVTKIQQLQAAVHAFQELYITGGSPVDQPFSRLIAGTKRALVAKKILRGAFVNQPFTTFDDDDTSMAKIQDVLSKVDSVLLGNGLFDS